MLGKQAMVDILNQAERNFTAQNVKDMTDAYNKSVESFNRGLDVIQRDGGYGSEKANDSEIKQYK